MVATANTDKNDTDHDIVANHAYSVLGAYDVEVEGETVRLIKLRNPWGYKEWTGDWCDDSSKWEHLADHLRAKLWQDHEVANDGCFFMNYEDYLKNY